MSFYNLQSTLSWDITFTLIVYIQVYGFRKDPDMKFWTSLSYFYVERAGRPGTDRYESQKNIGQIFMTISFPYSRRVCFPWAFWIKAIHALEPLFSNIIISEAFNISSPLLSNFYDAFLLPGECALQHLRIFNCCHWTNEMQHDEPVPRRRGRGGGRQW